MLVRMWGKGEFSFSIGGNVNWCRQLWKIVQSFLKNLKTVILYNLVIPLLGIYSKKTKTLIQEDTFTPVFIIILVTIGNI